MMLLAALLATTSLATTDSAPTLVGRVIRVVDGDTIDVELQSGRIRVRLYGIDAPERNQPYGQEGTKALKALLGETVDLEPMRQDRYERMIARVFIGELDVNLEMVRRGHAWAAHGYLHRKDVDEFSRAEESARQAKRGLWAESSWVAPWEWRQRKTAA